MAAASCCRIYNYHFIGRAVGLLKRKGGKRKRPSSWLPRGKTLVSLLLLYLSVGFILTFTPFINDFGLVTLEIEQEVSDVNTIAQGQNPTFFKRSISTNLVASQDQSIVLGGLVKERKSLDRTGLPWFYKIPVFGWLFGSRAGAGSSRNGGRGGREQTRAALGKAARNFF